MTIPIRTTTDTTSEREVARNHETEAETKTAEGDDRGPDLDQGELLYLSLCRILIVFLQR